MTDREMRNAVEIIPGKLFYVALSSNPRSDNQRIFFSIDNEFIYWNFYLDFGPLNLGHTFRFCQVLNAKINDPKNKEKVIYYYSGTHGHRRTNAVYLVCAWLVLEHNVTPEDAFRPFKNYSPPFTPWHDATPVHCSFPLTILDTIRGLDKARKFKYFNYEKFDIAEYEHFEQVENGDLNWCMDGKFIAFAGPHQSTEVPMEGYHALPPDHYIPYFKRKNVTLVIRFNKKCYDAARFKNAGIDHADLYFVDGTNPPDHILARFIQLCEETPGAVAVHCKAGLGRTGTCIGAYMMKHHRITAEEAIGWLRIVRPGSVIGQQQQYMKEIQAKMWREGDIYDARMSQRKLDIAETGKPVDASDRSSRVGSMNTRRKLSTGTAALTATVDGMQTMSLGVAVSRSRTITTSAEEELEGKQPTQGDLLRMQRAAAVKSAATTNGSSGHALPSIYVSTTVSSASSTPPSSAGVGRREKTPPLSATSPSSGGITSLFRGKTSVTNGQTTPPSSISRFMSSFRDKQG